MNRSEIVNKQIADLELIKRECFKLDEKLRDNIYYLEGSLKSEILSREWEYNPAELLGQVLRIELAINRSASYYYENKEEE